MATFRMVRADESDLAERRLAFATARAGVPVKWGGIAASLAAGDVILVGDVGDDDPDVDLFLWFHHERGEPMRTWWIQHLWGRSIKMLRIGEAACQFGLFMGATRVRWAKSTMAYGEQFATITNATLSPDGTYWEVPFAQALTRIQALIASRGDPPL